ncbi:MAG: substrate-binding domain-containing protein [Candidatus Accumulibacter sp.]|jgi:ABC-type molybdate transport system substrate-binding protein|nr:substrate-binding domain-containing protein [Accumulibacter sp.]
MKSRFYSLNRMIGVTAISMAVMQAYAAPTCSTVGTSGSVAFTWAVASNFYEPALSLATAYADSQNYQITVCHDSSGNLYNAIVPDNAPQYALFFSADIERPADISLYYPALVASGPYNYAHGIPTFLLSPAAYAATTGNYRAVNYLTTGLAAGLGASAESSDSSLPPINNYVALNRPRDEPSVDYLAIGDPKLAPYGVAASWILGIDPTNYPNNMNLWNAANVFDAGSNVTSSCSSLVSGTEWICTYSNIDYTLQAIAGDMATAGFVSYAQVCPVWADAKFQLDQYVLFPDYETTQAYVALNVKDATAQADATAFLASLGIGGTTWNTWLGNNCYKSL